jgi:hypothetical protein
MSFLMLLVMTISPGCHVLSPQAIPASKLSVATELIEANQNPIEMGRPVKWLDTAGWICGIPGKIMLWDRRIDNHRMTEKTIETTAEYLQANTMPHLKVRMNQYAPIEDFKRLRKNTTVAWPYRYTLGLLSVGGEAILPGRRLGGDHFKPFTQTVHLYSDVESIALHELAHAKDFSRQEYQGTYALAYLFMPTWHETIASRDALAYWYDRQDRSGIVEANRILYPAYGTYIGSALGAFVPTQATPIYYASVLGGHFNGRMLSREVDDHLREYRSLHQSH